MESPPHQSVGSREETSPHAAARFPGSPHPGGCFLSSGPETPAVQNATARHPRQALRLQSVGLLRPDSAGTNPAFPHPWQHLPHHRPLPWQTLQWVPRQSETDGPPHPVRHTSQAARLRLHRQGPAGAAPLRTPPSRASSPAPTRLADFLACRPSFSSFASLREPRRRQQHGSNPASQPVINHPVVFMQDLRGNT